MNKLRKEHIEKFLDEFMLIEYKGRDHIIARAHYRETFNELIPKYFEQKKSENEITSTDSKDDSIMKNIVIIGAGYGGLTAALRLERLLKKHPFFKVHLIDRNPYEVFNIALVSSE